MTYKYVNMNIKEPSMTKSYLFLLIAATLSGCGIIKSDLPDSYFICEHKYDSTRSFLVESQENVNFISTESCGILTRDNGCPVIVRVETINSGILFLSETELENYKPCEYKESIQ